MASHFTAPYYTTCILYCIALCSIISHCSGLRWMGLFHCIVLYYNTLYCTQLNCTALYCIALYYANITLHCIVLHRITSHCITSYTVSHCIALHCISLHCIPNLWICAEFLQLVQCESERAEKVLPEERISVPHNLQNQAMLNDYLGRIDTWWRSAINMFLPLLSTFISGVLQRPK